jgi:hypothetical protein
MPGQINFDGQTLMIRSDRREARRKRDKKRTDNHPESEPRRGGERAHQGRRPPWVLSFQLIVIPALSDLIFK